MTNPRRFKPHPLLDLLYASCRQRNLKRRTELNDRLFRHQPADGDFLNEKFHRVRRAVGIGKFANEALSENGIRQEHGLPLRGQYAAG